MPYNNTPIAPSKEITGHVSLPLARVQKIITADPERITVSKNGAFAIALATEMFIQHLATTTHNVVKAERKPRRNIQYRDVSSAIAKTDNLEFAVDVVPKTMLFKEARKRKGEREEREREKLKEREEGTEEQGGADVTTAPASPPAAAPPKQDDTMDVDERVQNSEPEDEDPAAMQLEMEMRGPPRVVAESSPEQQKVVAPKSPEAKSPEVKVNSDEQKAPATRRSTGGFTSINGAK